MNNKAESKPHLVFNHAMLACYTNLTLAIFRRPGMVLPVRYPIIWLTALNWYNPHNTRI